MITVKFYLKNPKDLKNTILVRVRAGRRLDLVSATSEYVNLDDWDAKAGACLTVIQEMKRGKLVESRSGDTRARIALNSSVNLSLSNLRDQIEQAYKKAAHTIVDKQWLQQIIFPDRFVAQEKIEEKKEPNLLEYAKIYLDEKENDYRKGKIKVAVVKKTKSIIKILERFIKNEGIDPPLMTEIDINFQRAYDDYCLEVEEYQPSYSNRTFKAIKTICFHASAHGYKINEGIRYLKITLNRSKYPTLSFHELEVIEKHQFVDEYLDNARDWLIIGAYSGQRCSDLLRFNHTMLETEIIDGKPIQFICFRQQKTDKQIRLALHYKILNILKKREGQFPRVISDQRFNDYIKKVAERAGIDEMTEGGISQLDENGRMRKKFGLYPKYKLITSHLCRRSFCTNFYGMMDTSILMLASGHTTEKQFREYIQDVDRGQAARFAKEINLLNTINFN